MLKKSRLARLYNSSRLLLVIMLLLATGGFICQWIYNSSPQRAVKVDEVRKVVAMMERNADNKIIEIERAIINDRVDSLMWIPFEKLPNTYLVYHQDKLIFWSNNQTEPRNLKNTDWKYQELSNVLALTKSKKVGDYNIVVFIPLKYNFPYENKELQNTFISPLNLSKELTFILNAPADKYAVFSSKNDYLFTLQLPEQALYNEKWSLAAIIFFFLSYSIYFYLFASFPHLIEKEKISIKEYFIVSAFVTSFIFSSLIFNFPFTFFQNRIFTPYHYASSTILSTLTHLSFLTAYLYTLIYLFCENVQVEFRFEKNQFIKRLLLLMIPGVYFILIFNFLVGVVFNSSTEINILKFRDITFVSLWNHLLFLVWGVSYMLLRIRIYRLVKPGISLINVLKIDLVMTLIICLFCYFYFGKYGLIAAISYFLLNAVLYLQQTRVMAVRTKWYFALWLFSYTLFVTSASIAMNKDKKFDKYKILAENHYASEDTEEDRIAISLLSDLNHQILQDKRILYLVQFPDSIIKANEYINNTYLRGFWNKYEMRLFGTIPDAEWDLAYTNEIANWGKRIKTTNFYAMTNPNSDLSFLGAFKNAVQNGKEVNFYMEFYPRRSYKSYSFPNLLIENPQGIQTQLSLSSARYAYRELTYVTGKFHYRTDARWIEKNKSRYFTQDYGGYTHYVFVPDAYNYYILSEEKQGGFLSYLLYFFYTFILYLCLTFLFIWLYQMFNGKTKITYKFSSRYLVAFIILLVLSFLSIFYVSLNFMQRKYVDEQKQTLELTKNYVQMALQEKYYWQEHLDSTMTSSLNFDLQDLSYIYQTDIHVYDNDGMLVGSSQPILFSRELVGRRISPIVYFSKNENNNQYERIGNLEYLAAYTDFYNGDFLQIGYIAVPQFLSEDLIQSDLESFLTVIVHIYLIITVLFILLSLIITRQLSSPLTLLQQSLKEIKIGQENKKINYRPNDEIGQLVDQYNMTVEELEKSAQLLAKSERESAWKTMARQVAHEINNPLTPMKLTIQHMQYIKSVDEKRFEEYFEKSSETLIEQIENLSKIASSFSSFAKLPEANFVKVDVARKLKSVYVLFSNNAENIELSYSGADKDLYAFADREQLILVFNNLIKNAFQAIPTNKNGYIDINVKSDNDKIYVFIKDNGTGMNEETKEKLFSPNFTTKSTGMGLGLAISKNIIQMLGGDITFESEWNVGTVFKIEIPKLKESS